MNRRRVHGPDEPAMCLSASHPGEDRGLHRPNEPMAVAVQQYRPQPDQNHLLVRGEQ